MARLPGWEKRLNAVVAAHQALPGEWGVSDCFIIPDDAVEAVTGEKMYPDASGYKTEAGAAKQLRKRGFDNVRQAFAAKLDEIPVAMAQRGDIGVIERDGAFSGGVFTAIGFMTRSHAGPVEFVPIDRVTAAFKVI
ncbi:hypothetical protein [Rhizobium sp. BG4]|uniref:DUF6950 family protein n=1 Tax=Rhizobium sp. BG4 TaxID=2613770 RepID=UPI00193DE69C|nr:hypothetical protein [Rhizobium sp. BG4]QRM43978.1 hypothetical protein F2982_11265 [Rhizobium sp. BG4]